MSERDERLDDPSRTDPAEERLRTNLRYISAGVVLLLIVVLALVDAFGKPAGLQVSEVMFSGLLGALVVLLGLEGAARWIHRP